MNEELMAHAKGLEQYLAARNDKGGFLMSRNLIGVIERLGELPHATAAADSEMIRNLAEQNAALLAENERLRSGGENLMQFVKAANDQAEAAEARYAALCEAEPVAVVDREAVGRVFWLSIIPDGTLLIPRPSMEGGK